MILHYGKDLVNIHLCSQHSSHLSILHYMCSCTMPQGPESVQYPQFNLMKQTCTLNHGNIIQLLLFSNKIRWLLWLGLNAETYITSPIYTRIQSTFIHFHFTVDTNVTRATLTEITNNTIL